MSRTLNHGMPLLAAGQAQKEVTHNEALLLIDRRLHLTVETRGMAAPPAAMIAGSRFIVSANATGPWAGRERQIASFDGFGWTFDMPQVGWLAWIADEAGFSVYDGTWSEGCSLTGSVHGGGEMRVMEVAAVPDPEGGSVIDVETRTVLTRLLAILRGKGVIG